MIRCLKLGQVFFSTLTILECYVFNISSPSVHVYSTVLIDNGPLEGGLAGGGGSDGV